MGFRIEQIVRLRAAARELRSSNDNSAREAGERIGAWLEGGMVGSLDSALGLRSRGGISARRALANSDRDVILRHLAESHGAYVDRDHMVVARQMRRDFDRYESGRWLRDRDAIEAPASDPAASFWRILRTGTRMPGAERLRQILAREIQ